LTHGRVVLLLGECIVACQGEVLAAGKEDWTRAEISSAMFVLVIGRGFVGLLFSPAGANNGSTFYCHPRTAAAAT